MKVVIKARRLPAIEAGLHDKPFQLAFDFQSLDIPFVATDDEYLFEISGTEFELARLSQASFSLDINGDELGLAIQRHDSRLFLEPYYLDERADRYGRVLPFFQTFGFVQLKITATGPNIDHTYYSDYLQVALRESEAAQDLKAMSEYVLEKSEWFAGAEGYHGQHLLQRGELEEVRARLHYFEKAIQTYESQFVFFSSHAKTRTKDIYKRDGFEKLRQFDAKTLTYVLSHPEELMEVRSNSGIALGGHFYAPKHTLVAHRTITKDTLENRAIMAFLKTLENSSIQFKKELVSAARTYGFSNNLPDGYISSTDAIFDNLRADWIEVLKELQQFAERLEKIQRAYEHILLPVNEPILNLPEATSTFKTEPHYRLLYELMAEGFNMKPLVLKHDQGLLLMLVNSQLYEYFTLAKLYEGMLQDGFSLKQAYHFKYPLADSIQYYSNAEFANTFVFARGETTYTLYYQPIIYGRNGGHENGIHLKRITRMSLKSQNSKTGVYVPDIVIKIESEGQESYIIGDSKYSALCTVRERYAKELAFRYLLTIRPTVKNATIRGLYIYYGKRYEGSEEEINAWDLLSEDDRSEPMFVLQGLFPKRKFKNWGLPS